MSGTILLRPGSWLSLDGEAVEVVSLEGATVTVRDAAGTWQAVGTATLLARACPLDAPEELPPSAGVLLAGLDDGEREALAERAGHVREMLTGYRSGSEQAPAQASRARSSPGTSRYRSGSRPRRPSWG